MPWWRISSPSKLPRRLHPCRSNTAGLWGFSFWSQQMKDAFYFPHDSNAIQDPKMMTLLAQCGAYGVGLFWIIIEILHQQDNGKITSEQLTQYLDFYGKQANWSDHILNQCRTALFKTGLLVDQDDQVYSPRVLSNKHKRDDLKQQGRSNALKRWVPNGVPMATQCDPNARKERKGKERHTPIVPKGDDQRFETFWKAYPKKKGKGAAEKAWLKIKSLEALFGKIVGAVNTQACSPEWAKEDGRFIPHPATWLNQRRWEDEVSAGRLQDLVL